MKIKINRKDKLPCEACRKTQMPMFLRCWLSEVEYGYREYKSVQPALINALQKDIPHEQCKLKILKTYDEVYNNERLNKLDS